MQSSNSQSKGFRSDINGLRAWAVIAVILFHFTLLGLPSGFIGVDVFFVISGYLMTLIVFTGLTQRNFSFIHFYAARIRRIIPALLVIVLTLLIFGWFLLPTTDYKSLATESMASLSFVSNVYFYLRTGYFDTAAHEKWLLHTWSLGVEAQFYILYPIFLILFWKIKATTNALICNVLLLFSFSIGLNLYWSVINSSAAFYLLPMRSWELLAGGLVFFANLKLKTSDRLTKLLHYSGWLLLLISFIVIDNSFSWPSYWAIFPVLGTSLIIFSNQQNSLLTNNVLAQWLGTRSYSLYLWHWPFSVFLFMAEINHSWFYVAISLLLCLYFAHLTYLYVETPSRKRLQNLSNLRELVTLSTIFVVFISCLVFIRTIEFQNRLPKSVELAAEAQFDRNPRIKECLGTKDMDKVPYCIYGEDDINALIVGDSHANAVVTGLFQATEASVLQMTLRGCPMILGAKRAPWASIHLSPICKNMTGQLLDTAQEFDLPADIPVLYTTSTSVYLYGKFSQGADINSYKPEIYFGETVINNPSDPVFQQNFSNAYVDTMCTIRQKYSNFYITRPIPEIGLDVPRIYSRRLIFSKSNQELYIPLDQYMARNKLVWDAQDRAAEHCGVKILNPIPYLCDTEKCYGTKNGSILYFDDDHLSETGNKLLIPMFKEIFEPKEYSIVIE